MRICTKAQAYKIACRTRTARVPRRCGRAHQHGGRDAGKKTRPLGGRQASLKNKWFKHLCMYTSEPARVLLSLRLNHTLCEDGTRVCHCVYFLFRFFFNFARRSSLKQRDLVLCVMRLEKPRKEEGWLHSCLPRCVVVHTLCVLPPA